jgi:hypothetical protein
VRFVFANSSGHPDADLIARHLAERRSLTGTEISALFGRNRKADQIHRATQLVIDRGIGKQERVTSGSGRPVERLIFVSSSNSFCTAWPDPPADAAYHGLAGEIVHAIEPHSEADPVALLVQLLVGFGNAVGRTPYAAVEADQHHTNLFTCLVGDTAKARKGTSWGHPRKLLTEADPDWSERIVGGLSSGEGLIAQVADEKDETTN